MPRYEAGAYRGDHRDGAELLRAEDSLDES